MLVGQFHMFHLLSLVISKTQSEQKPQEIGTLRATIVAIEIAILKRMTRKTIQELKDYPLLVIEDEKKNDFR